MFPGEACCPPGGCSKACHLQGLCITPAPCRRLMNPTPCGRQSWQAAQPSPSSAGMSAPLLPCLQRWGPWLELRLAGGVASKAPPQGAAPRRRPKVLLEALPGACGLKLYHSCCPCTSHAMPGPVSLVTGACQCNCRQPATLLSLEGLSWSGQTEHASLCVHSRFGLWAAQCRG